MREMPREDLGEVYCAVCFVSPSTELLWGPNKDPVRAQTFLLVGVWYLRGDLYAEIGLKVEARMLGLIRLFIKQINWIIRSLSPVPDFIFWDKWPSHNMILGGFVFLGHFRKRS